MERIMMDDKVFYIVDGLPNLVVPINTALIDLQSKRQSSGKSWDIMRNIFMFIW